MLLTAINVEKVGAIVKDKISIMFQSVVQCEGEREVDDSIMKFGCSLSSAIVLSGSLLVFVVVFSDCSRTMGKKKWWRVRVPIADCRLK